MNIGLQLQQLNGNSLTQDKCRKISWHLETQYLDEGSQGGEGGREGVSQGEMNYSGMTFPILSIVSHQISWKYDKRSFLSLWRMFLQPALMIRITVN